MKLIKELVKIRQLREAPETREVMVIRSESENHKEIRQNKTAMDALNEFLTSARIDGAKSGQNCTFVDPRTGADLEGVLYSSTGGVTINSSSEAVDAANEAIKQTKFKFYQFKKSVVLGPR